MLYMKYKITNYTIERAKELGVFVKPSKDIKHKLDVFDESGKYLTSVGAAGYYDYPTYIENFGLEYANKRRKLYKQRHKKDNKLKGFLADYLLW